MEKWVSLAGLIMPCKWCNKTETESFPSRPGVHLAAG